MTAETSLAHLHLYSQCLKGSEVKPLSCVRLFATPWTVATRLRGPWDFSRQEDWSGLPFPSPGNLPNPGIELQSPALQTDALPSEPLGKLFPVFRIILLTSSRN